MYHMLHETSFVTPADMLHLVRGCPLLVEAEWHAMDHDLDDTEHRSNIDAIDRLLKSRGGKEMAGYHRWDGNY